MEDANIPTKLATPFASETDSGNITSPFPVTAQLGGLASLETGFADINSALVASGGIPPWGKDMNGILNLITQAIQWMQAGGQWPYDGTFQTTVGGYAKGSIVQSAVNPGNFWFSTVDNNAANPDTGGAGWVPWPLVYYAVDTGTVNALVGAFPTAVPLAAIRVGTILYVNPAYTSTSTTPTLAASGGAPVTITAPTGAALLIGAIVMKTPAAIMVGPSSALWLLNPQVTSSGPAGPTGQTNGQCRLVYSSGTLVTLTPYGGNGLVINGVLQTVPVGGVTLNVSAASAGLNYVYAFMSGGTMTLAASATTYATGTNGTPVKSTDATQALVGMVYVAGGVFTAGLVLSWYNRRLINLLVSATQTFVTGPGDDLQQLASTLPFLIWADDGYEASVTGVTWNGISYTGSADVTPNGSQIWLDSFPSNAGPGSPWPYVAVPLASAFTWGLGGLLVGALAGLPGALSEGRHVLFAGFETGSDDQVAANSTLTVTVRG